jgi:hypothetical protein
MIKEANVIHAPAIVIVKMVLRAKGSIRAPVSLVGAYTCSARLPELYSVRSSDRLEWSSWGAQLK